MYLALSTAQIAPDLLVAALSAKAERLQKTGARASGELLAILPVAGKFLGFSKRQEALQKEEERRKKAEGKRQEAEMQIFSLYLSVPRSPTQLVAFSIEPSFKNRQGLSNSRRARRCKPKLNEPTLKKCIGE
ncbi:hypothetical protein [Microcoleus sp. herbarium14]|uniref:hypothetical protein n=1 Tax=Microcoleus sp. herbarium14 TaxID=3055439 RepID=UPI002FD61C70